jgi:molybdenum cofactor cytidylyltransferase
MSGPGVVGVLLAAGRGRRMGRVKQLLPWPPPDGSGTIVAAAFDAVAPACDEMVVVVGHEAEAVIAALRPRPFRVVDSNADAPMFESIRLGLRAARKLDPAACSLLHPADHPQVSPTTLQALRDAHRQDPHRAIMPVHGDRGGHPVLIPPALVDGILEAEDTGGLRAYWSAHPELCVRIAVDDPGVVRDLDVAADYERSDSGDSPEDSPLWS